MSGWLGAWLFGSLPTEEKQPEETPVRRNHQFFRFQDVSNALLEQSQNTENWESIGCQNENGRDPITFCEVGKQPIEPERIAVQITADGQVICWDILALAMYVYTQNSAGPSGTAIPFPNFPALPSQEFLTPQTLNFIKSMLLDLEMPVLKTLVSYLSNFQNNLQVNIGNAFLGCLAVGTFSAIALPQTATALAGLDLLAVFFYVISLVAAASGVQTIQTPLEIETVRQHFQQQLTNRVDFSDLTGEYVRELVDAVKQLIQARTVGPAPTPVIQTVAPENNGDSEAW